MALSYNASKPLENFKNELNEVIQNKYNKDYIKTRWEEDTLVVTITKAGSKSEFMIKCEGAGDQTKIREVGRKIGMLHKPFVGEVLGRIDSMMTSIGAKREEA